MKIKDIINVLEKTAHPSLQEGYDNAGMITGNIQDECTGILCSLDATEAVVEEAIAKKCNLIVAHHPIVFKGLKKITGKTYVERTIIKAIKNDIAIYAIHTNLDNIVEGVNGRMADKLGLTNRQPLMLKTGVLKKIYTFVPQAQAEQVRQAIFEAGAGHIGNYSECSFSSDGTGTFKGEEGTHPFAGTPGKRHSENEVKLEVIFPAWLQQPVTEALVQAHPYEEPAYDIVPLENSHPGTGSGLTGLLPAPCEAAEFLSQLKKTFNLSVIRHTSIISKTISRVSLCGGVGSFLISKALQVKSDIYITADVKYHEFFDADSKMILADIGHYESEQFTIDLLYDILREKFPTFAVLKTAVNTNPVLYYA